MSSGKHKIKYKEEAPYGSTNERTLFCIENHSSDYTSFYYDDGTIIFSFNDTLDDNIFEKMIEIIHKWKDNPNIEQMSQEEILKCK